MMTTKCVVTRRQFIRSAAAGGAAILLADRSGLAADPKVDVWVFHGEDKKKLMASCIKTIIDNGGFGKDAKKLTLKVNAAWGRTPEQGANTHPELVGEFLKDCKRLGVKELVVPENPCDAGTDSFVKSGILGVVQESGATMIDLGLKENGNLFREVVIPNGVKLKKALVGKDFLETDCLVNMPVAKHHGSTRLTIALKNWMGAVHDRGFWHRNDLPQCIADFSSFIKPAWTIVDATRTIMDNGPKGPAKTLTHPNLLILSRDQVAADAYASTLFPGINLDNLKYLAIARDMKLGVTDIANMIIHKAEVS